MDIIIYIFYSLHWQRFVQKSHRYLFRLCWTQLVCKINLCLVRPLDFWTERMLPQSLLCTSKLFRSRLHGEVHSGPVAFSVKCQVGIKHNLPQYFHLPGASSYWDSLSGARRNRYDEICVQMQKEALRTFHTYLNTRPRLSNEPLEVSAAELRRLVRQAFLDYGQNAIEGDGWGLLSLD